MKIIAASLISATAAFAPPSSFTTGVSSWQQCAIVFSQDASNCLCWMQETALNMHALGGWNPGSSTGSPPPAVEDTATSYSSAPAFSGFGHATNPLGPNNSPFHHQQQQQSAAVPPIASAPAGFGQVVVEASPQQPDAKVAPVFSGFGHASGPLGPNNSPFHTAAAQQQAAPPQTVAAVAPPAAVGPVFSGFGHASSGPDNSPFNTAAVPVSGTDATATTMDAAPAFSGFGHAAMPMGGGNSVASAPSHKSYLEGL